MAHKTNSKEQFMFKFYNFVFTVKLNTLISQQPSSVEQAAYASVLSEQLFPVFETNLLTLKSYLLSYAVRDNRYLANTNQLL